MSRIAPGLLVALLVCSCVRAGFEQRSQDSSTGPDQRAGTDSALKDAQSGEPDAGSSMHSYHFPAKRRTEVDVLFVIDNSNTMAKKQASLSGAFVTLVNALANLTGGIPDLRVGVVSSDLGAGGYSVAGCEGSDQGLLQDAPRIAGCTPPSGSYISYSAGKSNVAGPGNELDKVKNAFKCIATLGVSGCGFEQHLQAARVALDPKLNKNPGFLRSTALLVVILIADEDDCSAAKPSLYDPYATSSLGSLTSYRCFKWGISCSSGKAPGSLGGCKPTGDWLHKISDYATFYSALKSPGAVVLAALTGPPTPVVVEQVGTNLVVKPTCDGTVGSSKPGIRIKALLDAFPTSSVQGEICSGNYGPTMQRLSATIDSQLGASCLRMISDTDPVKPGLQAKCVVTEVTSGGTASPVAACKTSSGACNPCPCWRVITSTPCKLIGGYALQVARLNPSAADTVLSATCQGSPGSK